MSVDEDRSSTMPDESRTALGNAAARANETARPDRIFTDPLARLFLDAADAGTRLPSRRAGARSGDGEDNGLLMMIGDVIAIKTRFFDEYFERVCAAGCRQ